MSTVQTAEDAVRNFDRVIADTPHKPGARLTVVQKYRIAGPFPVTFEIQVDADTGEQAYERIMLGIRWLLTYPRTEGHYWWLAGCRLVDE